MLFGYSRNDSKALLKTITSCALLLALGVITKTFIQFSIPMFGVKSQELNFSYSVIMFAGIVFGPLWGGLVGLGADLIGCLISAEGAPIIGIAVTNFLVGFIPGVYCFIIKEKIVKLQWLLPFNLILISLASLHNSFWIKMIFLPEKGYWVYALPRLAFTALIIFPLNSVIIYVLLKKVVPALKKTGLLPQ